MEQKKRIRVYNINRARSKTIKRTIPAPTTKEISLATALLETVNQDLNSTNIDQNIDQNIELIQQYFDRITELKTEHRKQQTLQKLDFIIRSVFSPLYWIIYKLS